MLYTLLALRDEILELGCKNGDLEFVKLMMKKFDCDPESKLFIAKSLHSVIINNYRTSRSEQKEVVLSLGCQAGDLEMVTIMVDKYHCDPNGEHEVVCNTASHRFEGSTI